MKHLRYTCDICGSKLIKTDYGETAKIRLESIPFNLSETSNYHNNSTHRLEKVDLCGTCQRAVFLMLRKRKQRIGR
jgi:hypothetical protein